MLFAAIFYIIGLLFIFNGVYNRRQTKPAGIYAYMAPPEPYEIRDVKAYNRAVGNLIIGYAVIFIINGILVLLLKPVIFIIIAIVSIFGGAVAMMIFYEMVIVRKYFFNTTFKRGFKF